MAIADVSELKQGFQLGEWLIDPAHGCFETKGHRIHIEPKVMDVLLCLAQNHGEVVSRGDLLDAVWQDVVVSEEVLTRCISELRTALNDTHRERKFIRTVPKRGYCLIVTPMPPAGAAAQAEPEPKEAQPPTAADSRVDNASESTIDSPMDSAIDKAYATPPPRQGKQKRTFFNRWIGQETLFALAFLAIFLGYKWGADKLQSDQPPGPQALLSQEVVSAGIGGVDQTSQALDVVVLPFVNISAEDDYFSIGLAEDIRNKLIRTKGLRVAARTSSEVFMGQAQDVRDIGKALNARTVVEGTVRMDDSRIRLTVQLSETENGHPLWAETYERNRVDVFALQEEIATDVVKQLAPALSETEENAPKSAELTDSVQAYDNYLLGRFHWNKRTPESIQRAQSYFERAIELDPNYAAAYAGMADSILVLPKYNKGVLPDNVTTEVESLINKALSLNPSDPDANASRGLLAQLQEDPDTAEAYFQRALELNPNNSMALMWYGNLKSAQGLPQQAYDLFKSALKSDPLHPSIQINYLAALLMLGENQELLATAPYFHRVTGKQSALKFQLAALMQMGNFEAALELVQTEEFSGHLKRVMQLEAASALINLEQFSHAKQILDALPKAEQTQPQVLDLRAKMAAAAQDIDGLVAVGEQARPLFKGQPPSCDLAYYDRYMGITAWLQNRIPAAQSAFESSLVVYQQQCHDALPPHAETHAYLILTAKRQGQEQAAEQHYRDGLAAVEDAKRRGIGHASMWLAEVKLRAVFGELDQARAILASQRSVGHNLYGPLLNDPMLAPLLNQLYPTATGQAMHPDIADYQRQQIASQSLNMAKLGQ
ncbi:winged helix-turn-helix domain-containing protein [Halioxenophilus aromaticivorans]|uniref:OmpR/PhoB-type domain-containing protein n=1 Tax=Halioxenophilus aromaticivorans TaxID=1306992 RepID=A0AAV3U689_9ALTE